MISLQALVCRKAMTTWQTGCDHYSRWCQAYVSGLSAANRWRSSAWSKQFGCKSKRFVVIVHPVADLTDGVSFPQLFGRIFAKLITKGPIGLSDEMYEEMYEEMYDGGGRSCATEDVGFKVVRG